MGRKLINPSQCHPAPGFSHIAIPDGKQVIFFAGQVALDREFNVIGAGDLYAQTVAAMKNLGVVLNEVGASWDDVVRRTIYTTQPTAFDVITAAIDEVTGSAEHPAQTIVGVTGLALTELMIEIEATAVIN